MGNATIMIIYIDPQVYRYPWRLYFFSHFRPYTEIKFRGADVTFNYTGGAFWYPQYNFYSACLIDVTNFPFDQHICDMWFQSMSKFSTDVDLRSYPNSPLDMETYLSSFEKSQNWRIIDNSTYRMTQSQNVGIMLKHSHRVALRFTLVLKRRITYMDYLVTLPCIVLGAVIIVVYTIPPDRPDRTALGMYMARNVHIFLYFTTVHNIKILYKYLAPILVHFLLHI